MESGKIISSLIWVLVSISVLLILILISKSTITQKCFENIGGNKAHIKDYLTSCASNCWSKHDYGKEPNSVDCYSIIINSSEKITNKDIESISKNFNVKSYLNFDLNENTVYRIKLRYDYIKQEISVINEGYCGNSIIEGTEFCDSDANVCQEKHFGSCSGNQLCEDCICKSELKCDLCQPPTSLDPSTNVDWCKYCKSIFETSCSDEIDNDCDGKIDRNDDDCHISLSTDCSQSLDNFFSQRIPRLQGIGNCIEEVSKTTKIPILVLAAIPIGEGGWNIDNMLQNGICDTSLGNPSNKQSNNLYSIKATIYDNNWCYWRTFECYDSPIHPVKNEVECKSSYNCCISPTTTDCGNTKYKCYIRDKFRAYDNKCDSINDFANLVTNSYRYQDAMNYKDDPEMFVKKLQEYGYATSPLWSDMVIDIMKIIKPYLSCDT